MGYRLMIDGRTIDPETLNRFALIENPNQRHVTTWLAVNTVYEDFLEASARALQVAEASDGKTVEIVEEGDVVARVSMPSGGGRFGVCLEVADAA